MTRAMLIAGALVAVSPAMAQTPGSPVAPGAMAPVEATRTAPVETSAPPRRPVATTAPESANRLPGAPNPGVIPKGVTGGSATSATQ